MRKTIASIVIAGTAMLSVMAADAWSFAGYSLGQKVDTNGWKNTPDPTLVKKTYFLSQKIMGCYDQLGLIADTEGKIKMISVFVECHTEQEMDQAQKNAVEWLFPIYKSNPRYQLQKGNEVVRVVDPDNSRFIELSVKTLEGHKFMMIRIVRKA